MRTPSLRTYLVLAYAITVTASAASAQTTTAPVISPKPPAAVADYSRVPIDQLIDDLTLIDSQAPGIDSGAVYGGFIADDGPGAFEMGVLGRPQPTVPPQMRELVRRGANALPTLIAHLNDARPTKLAVGTDDKNTGQKIVGVNFFMFSVFSNEYDPRVPLTPAQVKARNEAEGRSFFDRSFNGRYTVKVGDICYVLIGQIVNRQLLAVRYQPSAGLVVNSPIETPSLAEQVKNDWGDADADALKRSLLVDLREGKQPYRCGSALRRLRFYYPDTYNSLQGDDLTKKRDFESN